MTDLVVTTSRTVSSDAVARAAIWSQRLDACFVSRNERSVEALCRDEDAKAALVVAAGRDTYHQPAAGIEYFFHPNLASMRIRNLEAGRADHLVRAMQLAPGDEVLDCTLARASDAILCAYVVGETGRVVGLEKVPVIAYLTIEGLRTGHFVSNRFTALMRRVDARCADHNDFLPACEDASFDVVYFDPVFHAPITESLSMADLRALAHKEGVTPGAVAEAQRVARRCVVIKQRGGTGLWRQLGVTQVHRGGGSRVEYGVLPASAALAVLT